MRPLRSLPVYLSYLKELAYPNPLTPEGNRLQEPRSRRRPTRLGGKPTGEGWYPGKILKEGFSGQARPRPPQIIQGYTECDICGTYALCVEFRAKDLAEYPYPIFLCWDCIRNYGGKR